MLRTCLFVFLLASSIQAQAPHRNDWDRGEARKVIKNAHSVDLGSFGDLFRGALGGALGAGSIPYTHGIWLTDDVCWALAVFAQREERRSDDPRISTRLWVRTASVHSQASKRRGRLPKGSLLALLENRMSVNGPLTRLYSLRLPRGWCGAGCTAPSSAP